MARFALLAVLLAALSVVAAASAGESAPASPTFTTSSASSMLVITGHGWGHGVGMGQWGAYGYALHGWSYERILAHYYSGTTIGTAPTQIVRVLLADGKRKVTLGSAAPWTLVDGVGQELSLPAGPLVVTTSLKLQGKTLVSPLLLTPGRSPVELGSAPYHGGLLVVLDGKRLQVVNVVDLESYLDGVVGAEVPSTWPHAALEAQAVAARSYALAKLQTVVTASPFSLYADDRSQVYRRDRRRDAGGVEGRGGNRRPRRPLRRQGGDHVLLVEHRWADHGRLRRQRQADPLPGVGARPLRHPLPVPRLGARPREPSGGRKGARPRRAAARCRARRRRSRARRLRHRDGCRRHPDALRGAGSKGDSASARPGSTSAGSRSRRRLGRFPRARR